MIAILADHFLNCWKWTRSLCWERSELCKSSTEFAPLPEFIGGRFRVCVWHVHIVEKTYHADFDRDEDLASLP
jgi:hypothetical protein